MITEMTRLESRISPMVIQESRRANPKEALAEVGALFVKLEALLLVRDI